MKRFVPFLPLFLLLLAACASRQPDRIAEQAIEDSTRHAEQAFGPTDTSLHAALRAIEQKSGGRLGIAAIHLESGWRTSYRGEETFPMASVGKLPMAIGFLRGVDAGTFRLDSTVLLTQADRSPGGSPLFHRAMRAGGSATMHELLEAMVINSDNTACDYLLRLAGGAHPIDSLMGSLGLGHIDVSHSEWELILLWAGVDPKGNDTAWTRDRIYAKIEEAGDTLWRAAEARLVDDPTDAAAPEDMARLLEMLQRRTLLAPATTDTLLAVMGRTVTGRGRLAGLLPPGTPIAHKTGTISSTTNDVGIITLPGGDHLVIAAFVKGSRTGVRAREQAIASAAQILYQHVLAGARKGS